MNVETELSRLWAAVEPPARDPAFTIAVMARIARRRLRREWLELFAGVVTLGLAARALAPTVDRWLAAGIAGAAQWATNGVLLAGCVLAGVWLATEGSRFLSDA